MILRDEDAAKDIVADIYVKVCALNPPFESITMLRSYLVQSIRNSCLNHFRQTQARRNMFKKFAYMERVNRDNECNLFDDSSGEDMQMISEAISTLPTQARKVALLVKEGLDTTAIASILDLAPQTIRNTKIRAIGVLQTQLMEN
jgi:RNA polymerase sigma-70 factor (ECF subfamily)